MWYERLQASRLIEAIEGKYQRVREDIEKGALVSACHSLEQLKQDAEALYERHLNVIRQQLHFVEPLFKRLEEELAKLSAEWTAFREEQRHRQEGRHPR